MSSTEHDPRHVHLHGPEAASPPPDEFDPANAELANALRKSFRVLKFVMFVLIGLYFLSGFFSVKPDEAGVVLRFGQIVGAGTVEAVKMPGWHWSLPFPIDQWQTVRVSERELRVEFMLKLTPEEEATGKIQQKYNNLSPERDDYLVTGDANILHANLTFKYRIDDVVDYITNVLPMPNPRQGINSPEQDSFPEYTILRSMARDAVISTAARFGALDIRGSKQQEFMTAVAKALNAKLDRMKVNGTSLGLFIDENNGVIASKSKTGALEAIMPPRQTQEVFDQVFIAQNNKSVAITKAKSDAKTLLVTTIGPDYEQIAAAVDAEYALVRRLSSVEAGEPGVEKQSAEGVRAELATQREKTEDMLRLASGEIRSIIKDAEIERDRVIQDAAGDYSRFRRFFRNTSEIREYSCRDCSMRPDRGRCRAIRS
ncbi:MAG: hypothetical protein IPK83_12570 [Planctomycetes bacterium]|nr:hypothetical protein [Planctomycetota bacterium]